MSTTVGTLTIEMAANIVRLQQDMDKARSAVENTMSKISKAAGTAGAALGALGVTVGVGAFASWIKGAIDAADETSKLAQKIGVTVPEVAGLQLAFRQSGLDAGALQKSMSKLSSAIADGNDAFVAMNISNKNADGTLKSTRNILGEVADKFQDYEDGAAKTALAIKLFGKSGADLIPLLNGGSNALDEFDDMAKKLGLTLDENTAKRAEKFNDTIDLMGQGFTGIGRQIAADILPTLEGLAEQFFTSMTEGDRLNAIAEALSIGLKALYVSGVALVGIFRAVGDTIYTLGVQAMAVMKGDFAGAVKAGETYAQEMKANWANSLAEIDKAWNANGSKAISTMTATSAAYKAQAPIINDETKKMAAEQEKLTAQYSKLSISIDDKIGLMLAEAQSTTKLTDGQKIALKITQDIESGTLKLTSAQKAELDTKVKLMLATEEQIAKDKDLSDTKAKALALSEKLADAQKKETDTLREGNLKLQEQNDTLRYGEQAMRAREIATLRSTATDLEFAAATYEGAEALAEQARLLRERADLMEDNTVLEEAKAAADEWKKTTESIESSLTDALMRGFESGKDFGKNLADTLVNLFKTLVLKPIIQPIAQGAASSVLSLLGMSSSASAATGGGGVGGGLMIGGATLGAQGAAFAEGFTTTVSGWLTGGAEVASMGSATSGAFTAGSNAAVAMPYVAAALVAANALGLFRSNATVGGGLTGTLGAGDVAAYDLNREGGTLFSGPDYSIANMRANEMTASVEASFLTMRESATVMAQVLGASTEQVAAFTMAVGDVKVHPDIAQLGLVLDGLTEEQKAAKLQEVFAAANEAMAKMILGATDFSKAGETAYETLQRLFSIQLVSESLNEFGGAFSNFANASVGARDSVIELVGGIEQLMTKAKGFVTNFYTAEEQAGITARGVVQALTDAGFTEAQIATLQTRGDFRALLETLSVDAENGAKQFATLLNLQDEYASITGVLEEQGKTLYEIMGAAPQVAMLQKILESDTAYNARRETAAEQAAQASWRMIELLGSMKTSIDNLAFISGAGLDKIAMGNAAALSTANAALAAAQASARASERAAEEASYILRIAAAMAPVAGQYSNGGDGFASGGYMTGPALVGEHGPELFDPRTSQIYTAPATSNIFGGNEVAAEIRALRDEVSLMRSETQATAVNTSKIARLQDNWDVRGLTVRTDADQPLDTVAA